MPRQQRFVVPEKPTTKRRLRLCLRLRMQKFWRFVSAVFVTPALFFLVVLLLYTLFLSSENDEQAEDKIILLLKQKHSTENKVTETDTSLIPKTKTITTTTGLSSRIVFVGLVKNSHEIQNSTWDTLRDICCQHKVSIYITVAVMDHDYYYDDVINKFTSTPCATFQMELQSKLLTITSVSSVLLGNSNRLQRLARIRDAQRRRVQELFFPSASVSKATANRNNTASNQNSFPEMYQNSIVILSDLDLFQIPNVTEIMKRVNLMLLQHDDDHHHYRPDILCASGKIYYQDAVRAGIIDCQTGENLLERQRPKKASSSLSSTNFCLNQTSKIPYASDLYYDSFATVLWPDSFPYPLSKRMVGHDKRPYPGEDAKIWRMGGQKLSQHLRHLATAAATQQRLAEQLVPMRSCFSGLTLYRASTWLEPTCQYSLVFHKSGDKNGEKEDGNSFLFMKEQPRDKNGQLAIMRYASKQDELPCEHVVFHDCLHRKVFAKTLSTASGEKFNKPGMVLDPDFVTYWVVP